MKDIISPFQVSLKSNELDCLFIICLLERSNESQRNFPKMQELVFLCRANSPKKALRGILKKYQNPQTIGLTYLKEINCNFLAGETIFSRFIAEKISHEYVYEPIEQNMFVYCEVTKSHNISKGYLEKYILMKNEENFSKYDILEKENVSFVTFIETPIQKNLLFSIKYHSTLPSFIPLNQLSKILSSPQEINATGKPIQQELPLQFMTSGVFEACKPTLIYGKNLDIPTWMRKGIELDLGEQNL